MQRLQREGASYIPTEAAARVQWHGRGIDLSLLFRCRIPEPLACCYAGPRKKVMRASERAWIPRANHRKPSASERQPKKSKEEMSAINRELDRSSAGKHSILLSSQLLYEYAVIVVFQFGYCFLQIWWIEARISHDTECHLQENLIERQGP